MVALLGSPLVPNSYGERGLERNGRVSMIRQMGDLEGRSVVIIGGTSGLGLSAAQAFVREGAHVVVTGRKAETLAAALDQLGSSALGIQGDAAQMGSSEEAIAEAVRAFGKLDALYHVAGGSGRSRGDGALHKVTDEGIDFTLNLNLKSVIASNRAAIRQFQKQGTGGAILNMGSVLGEFPAPKYFASHVYAATKAAIVGFSRSIAAYYAPENIRVNVITPALVETPMSHRALGDESIVDYVRTKQPLDGGRVGEASDLDAAAVFLLSDGARFVTGQVLGVDGGWSVSEGQLSSR